MADFDYNCSFNKENGCTIVSLTDPSTNMTYYGRAICHPNDRDMMSEKTGAYIAEKRATIKALKAKRHDIALCLKEMTYFYNSVKDATAFESNGFIECKIIKRINILKSLLSDINDNIEILKADINRYITCKDILYTKIRKNRSKND